MKLTHLLSVAVFAVTTFSTVQAAALEFNGMNPAQLRARAIHYKAAAGMAAVSPIAGTTTEMLMDADVNAYLAAVRANVNAAFDAAIDVYAPVVAGAADVIFNPLTATGTIAGGAHAGVGVAADTTRIALKAAFTAMINAVDNTHAGLDAVTIPALAVGHRNMTDLEAQKAAISAGIETAITNWLDALVPGGDLVVLDAGAVLHDLAGAGAADESLGELKGVLFNGARIQAAH